MADYYSNNVRNGWATTLISEAGTNPVLKVIKGGLKPPYGQGLPGGYSVVATINIVGSLGAAANGIVTCNTNVTQNNSLHVTSALNPGVDSFLRLYKADGVTVVADLTSFVLPQVTQGVDIPVGSWQLYCGGNV